jgi:GH15 family glucan-1,4-alpha-glucosidase
VGVQEVRVKSTTIAEDELGRFLQVTRDVFRDASVSSPRGRAILATPPSGKYPCIYTRDLAITIAALCELDSLDAARDFCRFLLRVQNPDGSWVQRFDPMGRPSPVSVQEDATALAIWALLTFVKASGDDTLAEVAREPIERATTYTVERTLNSYLYLVETTSSIHESEVSRGYEIWSNCAHAAAFALCHRVYGGERYRRLALMIRRSIGLHMVQDNRFLRRLDSHGHQDLRPDVTIMSPYYFGLWSPTERAVLNSAEVIETSLWNVEIGGYIRYLPFSPSERLAVPGPYPHFTAWMAQYQYAIGNQDRAEAIMRWLFDNAVEGQMPEITAPASSIRRFAGEVRNTIDAMQPDGLRDGAMVQEIQTRRRAELDQMVRESRGHEVVPANLPYIWAHVETLRALKRGGYVERWELEPSARHST